VADLSYSFHAEPTPPRKERLPAADLQALIGQLRELGIELGSEPDTVAERLAGMRSIYEPYVNALADRLELPMPPWLAPESPTDNWRTTQWH
jgi:hypothetical protein